MKSPAFLRYHQTKLANAVFTKALHAKLTAKQIPIKAICADPGFSITNLGNHLGEQVTAALQGMVEKGLAQTSQDGTMGILMGLMHPDAQSGVHYGPEKSKGPVVINPEKDYEKDPANIALLWETSEAATGVKFEI